jgi:hypothetical protein
MDPFISHDGDALYFGSARSGGYGGYDIYRSTRQGSNWSMPHNLGPEINSDENDNGPWLNNDKTVIYFHSRGHNDLGGGDLFRSLWDETAWGPAVWLGHPLNSIFEEASPTLRSDRGFIMFHSDRPGGLGDQDLCVSLAANPSGLSRVSQPLPDEPDEEERWPFVLSPSK